MPIPDPLRRATCLLLAVAVLGCGSASSPTGATTPAATVAPSGTQSALAVLVAKVEPSVVRINTTTKRGEALGSGFVVSDDGRIVTNFHVIDDAESAVVVFADGSTSPVDSVLAHDADLDVAIVSIKAPRKLATVPLSEQLPAKGELAIALGSPKGLSFSVTEGIISAVRNGAELKEFTGEARPGTWIQTSASITSGNSGGPLFDRDGRVVGMNTFILRDSGDLGFAISATDIRKVVDRIPANSPGQPLPLEAPTGARLADERLAKVESSALSKRLEEAKKLIEEARSAKRERLQRLADQLAAARNEMKVALIEGDESKRDARRLKAGKAWAELKQEIPKPLALPRLSPRTFKTFQLGYLGDRDLRVIQVIDREAGGLLLMDTEDRFDFPIFQAYGLDVLDVTDGQDTQFSRDLVFFVMGTTTYTTVQGSAKTVFQLLCVGKPAEDESTEQFRALVNAPYDVTLADLNPIEAGRAAENAKIRAAEAERQRAAEMALAKEKQMAAEAEAKLLAEQQRANEERLEKIAKAKRSKSSLAMGKNFLEKNNMKEARKYLQRAVDDDPESESGIEAAKLLKFRVK